MLTVSPDRLVPDYIREFEPYIPSKPDPELKKLYGCERLYRLNNNESPLGPPLKAQAVLRALEPLTGSVYPSGDSYYLREKLAGLHGLSPDQFLFGNGANEVIGFVIKAFCQKGDNVITADKTFAVYEWVARFSGIEARLVPLKNFGFDGKGMLERIDGNTKVIFICNPNNPTGSWWNRETLRNFLDMVAGRQIVVVDEAYIEFVERDDFPDGIKLISEYPNLVVFQDLLKMYGLAGLRIGYLAGSSSVVDVTRRACMVYSVNAVAQLAAYAALDDAEHVRRTREHVKAQRAYLLDEIRNMGLQCQSGEGCFIMIKLPMSDTLAYRMLMSEGVMVRSMTGFRFPNWIRVSVGKREEMTTFISALRKTLEGRRVR